LFPIKKASEKTLFLWATAEEEAEWNKEIITAALGPGMRFVSFAENNYKPCWSQCGDS